jgi:hypothetical protein
MDQKTQDLKQTLILQPSLLSFESELDYRRLDEVMRDHISPRDILEEMWISEIVEGEWETARLRRYKGQIVKLAKVPALRNLLNAICADADEAEIDALARRWFTNKTRIQSKVVAMFERTVTVRLAKRTQFSRLSQRLGYMLPPNGGVRLRKSLDKPLVWPIRSELVELFCLDEEPRMAAALRRSLRELRRLERYERDAFSQRRRACRDHA